MARSSFTVTSGNGLFLSAARVDSNNVFLFNGLSTRKQANLLAPLWALDRDCQQTGANFNLFRSLQGHVRPTNRDDPCPD